MKLVIVGGVAGGASAAARARRLSEDAEIVVLERGLLRDAVLSPGRPRPPRPHRVHDHGEPRFLRRGRCRWHAASGARQQRPDPTVVASVAFGSKATRAEATRLTAPAVTSTEGITLAGAAVAADGTWTPQPGEIVPCADGSCDVSVPIASAVLLTIN